MCYDKLIMHLLVFTKLRITAQSRTVNLVATTCVTPACVAPRHVDAPRDFLIFYFFIFLFFSERAARGGGGGGVRCQTFSFLFFPVQQTTSGIGHRVK